MSAYNFFSYREKDRITDHKAAMESWNKNNNEMEMQDKYDTKKNIKIRVEFIPVCFSVNSFMFSWLGKFLGIGRNYIDKYNKESVKKLIGDPSTKGFGGLVGKFLEENKNYDKQKIKKIENLYK